MTEPTSTSVAAGWYADPAEPSRLRWWDGAAWTEHLHQPVAPQAPIRSGTNTLWIWLILALSLLALVPPVFIIDWSPVHDPATRDPNSGYTLGIALARSPSFMLANLLGWLIYGASVLFAYFDAKALKVAGVFRPFHWAFAFISSIVYLIGRGVVIGHRTGRGLWVMWAAIAVMVLGIITWIVLVSLIAIAIES